MLDRYLRERGDANIKSLKDLIDKSQYYRDIRPEAGFIDRKAALEETNNSATLDMANVFQDRFAYQQVVLQCMAQENLDALVSPAGNIPAYILGQPIEPPLAGRTNSVWGLLGQHGFPTLSVPAGFTTQVFDRVRDAVGARRDPPDGAGSGETSARGHVRRQAVCRADAHSHRIGLRGGNEAPRSAAGLRPGSGALSKFRWVDQRMGFGCASAFASCGHVALHALGQQWIFTRPGPRAAVITGSNATRMAIGCRKSLEGGDATAGVHRGARKHGGVASGGAGAATGNAGRRISEREDAGGLG